MTAGKQGALTLNVWEGASGKFYWHIVSGNGEVLSDGTQGYSTKSNARRAGRRFVEAIRTRPVIEP